MCVTFYRIVTTASAPTDNDRRTALQSRRKDASLASGLSNNFIHNLASGHNRGTARVLMSVGKPIGHNFRRAARIVRLAQAVRRTRASSPIMRNVLRLPR